jgi:transposase
MESIGKIRMKHHRKGESIREIARTTGFSRNTVRKYLRGEDLQAKYERNVIIKPKLGPFEAILREWLIADENKPKKERAYATTLFERLKGVGYLGEYDSVQRYVKEF